LHLDMSASEWLLFEGKREKTQRSETEPRTTLLFVTLPLVRSKQLECPFH
jgi:hypothetical protein